MVERQWLELPTGKQLSSITHHLPAPPPMALDPRGGRFAVAIEDRIHVVQVDV